ncbi:putative protein-S-isoprenylcysteine O-methyltransferase [Iris pallida]|uniref:Protein-S-isoprenylcysteine O-methyltransferase n=1 Tax=Iris pallida TaxID=29817 RepID=A0AAX6GU14_IRIPA|nr:putative protein-S-isoprenylcysteine O-methyltransferase [Iris pallida]
MPKRGRRKGKERKGESGGEMGVKYSSSTAVAQLQLSQFLAALFFFHGSEYVLAAAFHGRYNVSLSSLLISKQYVVAMACALVEYFIEYSFFPELKNNRLVSNIGLFLVLLGEVIRKTAILTARKSFTHNIRIRYEDQHVLITHGIYRFMRHPSYCGFFIWAIGTQVMICNRFCIVAFAVVIWQFFYKRIPYEEFFLKQFFGSYYVEYARHVPSGLPFIK